MKSIFENLISATFNPNHLLPKKTKSILSLIRLIFFHKQSLWKSTNQRMA